MPTKVKLRSDNRKLGRIVTLDRTFDTCPEECRFLDNGCYATGRWEYFIGRYGLDDWRDAVEIVTVGAPRGSLVRLHAVGDVMYTDPDARRVVDHDYVAALNTLFTSERTDLTPLLFTHAWRLLPASAFGFPVNASCETPTDLPDALAAGYQPSFVTVDPDDPLFGTALADGRRVIRCPEQTLPEQVTCDSCRLCTKDWPQRTAVGFVVHGQAQVRATRAVTAAKDGLWGGRQLPWLEAAARVVAAAAAPLTVRQITDEIDRVGYRDLRRAKTPTQTLARDLRLAAASGDRRFVRVGTCWTAPPQEVSRTGGS